MTRVRSTIRSIAFYGVLLLPAAYAAFARPIEDWLAYPPVLIASMAGIAYLFFQSQWFFNGFPGWKRDIIYLLFLYTPAMSIYLGIVYYGAWVVLKDAYYLLQSSTPPRFFTVSIVALTVAFIGFGLFRFREVARFFYGAAECLLGVIIAIQRIPEGWPEPFSWDSGVFLATMLAGVFFVVRGLDNIKTGLAPDSYDALLKGIKEYGDERFARLRARLTKPEGE